MPPCFFFPSTQSGWPWSIDLSCGILLLKIERENYVGEKRKKKMQKKTTLTRSQCLKMKNHKGSALKWRPELWCSCPQWQNERNQLRTNLYSQKVTMVQGYKCCWSLEERQLVCVSAYVLMLAREDEVTDFFIVFSFGNQVNRSVIVNMPFSLCCHSNKDIYTKVLILSRAQLCYYTLRIFSFLSSANCYLVHWSF